MPRTNDANKLIKDERKQSIISAALPLFVLYGDKVSVDMICEKAKCSHGLLYHYFKDANNVLQTIKKSERFLSLQTTLLDYVDNGSQIDAIYQIISSVNSAVLKVKNDDVSILYLVLNNHEKISFKSSLASLVKEGQKNGQVTAGKPEDLVLIYINYLSGVLLKKILQKSYKIEIQPIDNLMQIFIKKTARI